jgi:hypothetical protein
MPVTSRDPYRLNEVTTLFPQDPSNEWLDITMPDGRQIKMRKQGAGVEVWLGQLGTWTWSWSEDDYGTLEVLAPDDKQPEVFGVIEGG